MALDNPRAKMSKSSDTPDSYISMLDDPDTIAKKIRRAVTDSDNAIRYAPQEKPGVSNLMSILSLCSGRSLEQLEEDFAGKGYGQLKQAVAEAVIAELEPIQQRYRDIVNSNTLDEILDRGARRAQELAAATLYRVQQAMGL
jgi:tryptophanyl-tRNA synthetase